MSEALAQKKFSCPACGAEARWDPGKKALVCPFCGTTSPAQAELAAGGEQVIVEGTQKARAGTVVVPKPYVPRALAKKE